MLSSCDQSVNVGKMTTIIKGTVDNRCISHYPVKSNNLRGINANVLYMDDAYYYIEKDGKKLKPDIQTP